MQLNSRYIILALLFAIVVMGGLFWSQSTSTGATHQPTQEEPELAEYMHSLHYYSQKLILAIANENEPLADFYLHEIEELAEELEEEVPEYERQPIGELVGAMLMPEIGRLEDQLPERDWEATTGALEGFIESCNSCHVATDYGFIQITAEPVEAFNQDFSPNE